MLFFLYGPDTYRSRQKLNEMIDGYKKTNPQGLSLKYFDANCELFNDLIDELQQISMFGEKRLVVVRNVFADKSFKEKFSENYKKLLDSSDLIVVYEENTPKKEKLFDLLKEKTKSQEFVVLEGVPLKNWLKKELDNQQVKINPQALELFLEYAGSDLWQLSNEIKKLADFKKGGTVTPEDIKLLVKPVVETDIFKTIDAIAQKNKKQAFFLIHQHLQKGEAVLYLLSMINFQLRNLLIIKDLMEKNRPYYAILKTTKMHPFVVRKSYELAKKFTFPELKKIYQKLFEVDLDIKTGKMEPDVALDLFISSI